MALETVEDIIRALQEHPEWREPLLNALLTDQYRQLPSRADRLEEALARLAAAQEATQQALQRFTEQTEQRFRQVEEQQRQQAARHDELVEKLIQLTARVDQIAEQMAARFERLERDVGELKGLSLEQYYRNNATALLGLFFRKLRVVDKGRLIDTLYEQRALTREEWEQISQVDLLVKGIHRSSDEERLLVWEISWTVDEQDVSRAIQRSQLLRQWGLNTVPVVAGKGITGNARATALSNGVLVLLDTIPLDGSGLV
ncbi:MAG: hypothetical protein KatS3mg023_0150 [Armatimonadota bacterium]|nr:MAG: hypothetical protein KatS3mg023_0150 [Armatimonadota bacterium]